MKKRIATVFLSLLLTLGIGGMAHALEYSTNVSFFSDGLDFDTGEVFQDPTVLAIVVGSEDEIERVFKPLGWDIPDFSSYPGVDVHFEFDPVGDDPILAVSEYLTAMIVLEDTSLSSLDFNLIDMMFQNVVPTDWLAFDPNDVLLFKSSTETILALEITSFSDIEPLSIHVKSLEQSTAIPEPSSLILIILGGFSIGIIKFTKRKNFHKNNDDVVVEGKISL